MEINIKEQMERDILNLLKFGTIEKERHSALDYKTIEEFYEK
jgi:hypothetical protein